MLHNKQKIVKGSYIELTQEIYNLDKNFEGLICWYETYNSNLYDEEQYYDMYIDILTRIKEYLDYTPTKIKVVYGFGSPFKSMVDKIEKMVDVDVIKDAYWVVPKNKIEVNIYI